VNPVATGTALIDSAAAEETSRSDNVVRSVLRSAEGRIGIVLIVILAVIIVAGPALAPYSPTQIGTGLPLSGPSTAHYLGTDELGRDVWSRFLNGGRSVLTVPLLAVTISLVIGGFVGVLAAYKGGVVDSVVSRIFDIFMVLPALLIVLVLIAGLGTSDAVVIAGVAIFFVPRIGRLIRGAAQAVVVKDYVLAAQLRGERTVWIVRRELLPNITGQVLVVYALHLTYGIIFVATLSFLGLGAQPPSSNWGLMVSESQSFISQNFWATLIPALGIAAICVSFTLIADAVNRHLARSTVQLGSGV
jgi:peptide/nickel transport system permease protein